MSNWGPQMDKFKSWAFPGLVMILATIIWQDVREIKSDIKALMAQTNIDKTRIDNLERSVYGVGAVNFPSGNLPDMPADLPKKPDLFYQRQDSTKKKIFRPDIASNL
jgi:hypothetical protein